MIAFPMDKYDRMPRTDKPHIAADGVTITWQGPHGPRKGYAEEGHGHAVAKWIYEDYMTRN